jgi:hypothetical protein
MIYNQIFGYTFGQSFKFAGQLGFSSIALMPTTGGIIFAVFSIVDSNGVYTDDCQHIGNSGAFCISSFQAKDYNRYLLDVRNTEGTTWTGTVIELASGHRIHIGSITLPYGTATTVKSGEAVVQYHYSQCDELPNQSVTFGPPSTDAGVGSLKDPYEVGKCAGQENFRFKRTKDGGVDISVGFRSTARNVRFQNQGCSSNGI